MLNVGVANSLRELLAWHFLGQEAGYSSPVARFDLITRLRTLESSFRSDPAAPVGEAHVQSREVLETSCRNRGRSIK